VSLVSLCAGDSGHYNSATLCPCGTWVCSSSRGVGFVHSSPLVAPQTTACGTKCICHDGGEAGGAFGNSSNHGCSSGCDSADVVVGALLRAMCALWSYMGGAKVVSSGKWYLFLG
jgi:hypothetical protein